MLILAAVPTFSQSSGTILGVVKDTSGGTVPEAKVTIVNTETTQSRTVTTSDDGAFRVPALPVGHYNVRIEKEGFKTQTQQGLVLDVAQELVVTASLQVGTSAQEVVVTGEAPLVNTTTSTLGGLVNEDKMAELPLNGRNYIDLSLLQPGVSLNQNHGAGAGQAGTWFSSNGAPTYSNYVTIDGAPMINMMGGSTSSQAGTTLGVDGIKEYKVITNTFGAEYGMTMGSQMVAVSKSGTNVWHGSVFEYLRNDHLDARNPFDTEATAGKTISGAQRRLPVFQRNNFGASVGGPVKKDKTFFYAVYEGLRQIQGFTAVDNVPLATCYDAFHQASPTWQVDKTCDPSLGAGTPYTVAPVMRPFVVLYPRPTCLTCGTVADYSFPTTNRVGENFGQIRADQTFSDLDSLFGRYTIDSGLLNNAPLSVAPSTTGQAIPGFRLQAPSRNQFLTLGENHIFSSVLLNTARLSFSRTAWDDVNIEPSSGLPPGFVPGLPMGTFSITSFTSFGPTSSGGAPPGLSFAHIQNIYTLSDDVFYTHGKHALKFGALFNRYNQGMTSYLSAQGTISFTTYPNFLKGIYNSFTSQDLNLGSDLNRFFIYNTVGFYAQDDWRATSRLTVNLGLRYEFSTTPWELNNKGYALRDFTAPSNPPAAPVQGPVFKSPSKTNFSPRIGFAWDAFGNGKTSVRSGFGLYFDVGNIGAALLQQVYTAPPVSTTSQHVNTQPPAVLTLNPDGSFQFTGSDRSKALHTSDYNAGQPHLLQYNLSVEQQLPGGVALSVAYVGTRGIHLWTAMEGNPTLVPYNGTNGATTYYSTVVNGVKYWSTTIPGGCGNNLVNGGFCRRNSAWGNSILHTTDGDSNYSGLQVSATKRISHGLQLQGSYTWSHAIDDTQGQMYSSDCSAAQGMASGVDPWNTRNDRGPSCFDVRHNLRFNLLYHFPSFKSNGFLSKLENGWWMGSIVSAQTGYAFTPMLAANRSQDATLGNFPDRVDLGTATVAPGQTDASGATNGTNNTFVPFDPNTVILRKPDHWFNPLMFTQSPITACPGSPTLFCGRLGNIGRGLLRGPGLGSWDFSLTKDTPLSFLGEGGNLQFRAEFFNVLNRTNFGMPNGTVFPGTVNLTPSGTVTLKPYANPLGAVGAITTTSVNSRQVQLALKIIF
jgi:hypothetical protein